MAALPDGNATTATGKPRIVALDSMRGIAALSVVFHHLGLTLEGNAQNGWVYAAFHHVPLRFLLEGRTAVILFFVLSGFALSISIEKNFQYRTYLVRRLCRLMIPCIAAILFAAAAYVLVSPQPVQGLNDWFNYRVWNVPVTPQLVLRHILMIGTERDTSLDDVLWSLVIELRVSLIFPVLYFLVRGRTWLSLVLALATQLFFTWLVTKEGHPYPLVNNNLAQALENFGYYAPFFVAGILARNHMEDLRRWIVRLHPVALLVALLVGIELLDVRSDALKGFGSVLLISLCVSAPPVSRALSIAPIEWLGKISYSLYLVHLVVLAAVFHLLYGKFGNNLLCLAVLVISLGISAVFYFLIENPSIQLGRRLTATRRAVAPVVSAR